MNLAGSIALQAYGTSEGMKKAWDTRGRGQHTMGKRDKSKVRALKTIDLPSGAKYYIGKPVGSKMLTPPSKVDLAHNQPGRTLVIKNPEGGKTIIKLPAGRLWPEEAYWKNGNPQVDQHDLAGKFRKGGGPDVSMLSNATFKQIPGASTTVYSANKGSDGATVFSTHNEETGEGRIIEFSHAATGKSKDKDTGESMPYGGHLQYSKSLLPSLGSTQVTRFSSGRAHSNYLRQRYRIKKDFKS